MEAVLQHNYARLILVVLIGLLISLSWLVFPYLLQGKNLLRVVGDNSRSIQGSNVSQYYTRTLANNYRLQLTATFASAEFFQFVDNVIMVGNLRPDKNYIFFVSENIHEGLLATELPEATLIVGQQRYVAQSASGPQYADHHRVTVFSFPKRDKEGEVIDLEATSNFQLEVAGAYFGSREKTRFIGMWLAPYSLPEELKSGANVNLIGVVALGAGLLSSVLTPCLLQLLVMFGTVMAGYSTVPTTGGARVSDMTPIIRHKIMQVAVAFVISFVLLYMLAGALIGAIGHQAQLVFAEFSRPIAIISGIIVILLGMWLGLRATRPFACKVHNAKALHALSIRDTVATVVTSVGYALGCTACFGGAIVATLIIYVGTIGSAAVGAGIMLIFSVGVAIPFLLAALYFSKIDCVLIFLVEKSRAISLVGMVLVIALGLILVTDNFHVVSDMIYPHLALNG